MLEGPEIEAHRHKTGHSHIDLILGALAVVMSMISVFIAVRHGQTMERLVAANSWPNISYTTGNEGPNGAQIITMELRNTGVGPARIDTFELFYKDRPLNSPAALLAGCCMTGPHMPVNSDTSTILNEVLPARDAIDFLSLDATKNPIVWDKLNKERFQVRVRVCYCSVFEECWVKDSRVPRPTRVDECKPSQPIQYDQTAP